MPQRHFYVRLELRSNVVQAEQELFPAELDWAADRARLCSSIVGIYKAMGGGWVAAADKLTASSSSAAASAPR